MTMQVVIVGRDTALWLTAAALRQALAPAGVAVTAVELPSRLSPASVHAALPALEALHAKLGLDEAAVLGATRGSFTLGFNIAPPGGGAPFFLAHGAYGAPIEGGDFFPYWLKARRFGLDAALEDFSATAMAARHGRMMLPDAETEAFGRTDYGYHLPAIAYAAMLKRLALRLGVTMRQAVTIAVERDPIQGSICGVRSDGGDPITGDLFIDASGAEAVLIGDAPGVGCEDWRSYFPLDRRLVAQAPRFASLPVYAEVRADARSWTALHAAQDATHVVHCYTGNEESDEAALAAAARRAGLPLDGAVATPTAPARRLDGWSGNCVAIGAAACAFDPLFEVDLHAVQLGIVHLLSLFPVGEDAAAERAEYNRITTSLFERIRDFQAAFYALAMASQAPKTLAHRIAAFRARGIIAPMEDDSFPVDQWRALFTGLGLPAESWPPAIDDTPPEAIKQGLRRILGFVKRKVLEQPTHDAYLADLGGKAA